MKKKYTGVILSRKTQKYQSKVTHNGIVYNCGQHNTPEAAARARDIKILEKNLPVALQVLKKVEKPNGPEGKN